MRLPSPRAAAWILTLLIATPIAADLLWMPVQVYDSVGEILDAQQSPSISASVTGSIGAAAYLRPMRIAQIKALFDLAGGEHYWLVYRGFHALLLIATLLLFTAALRVSTAVDVAALAFALAASAAAAMTAKATDYIPPGLKDQIVAHTALLGPRKSDEITFKVPDAPGDYPFLCSFPAHFQVGMKGVLTVK